MKTRTLIGSILVVLLALATTWGQTQTESQSSAQTPSTTPPATSKPMQHQHQMQGSQGMQGMSSMHQQHMQEMQANLAKMHSLLMEMRTNVTTMNPKDQPPMMANIQLWQLMLDHLDSMMEHMQSMGSGMGEGMMQHQPPAKKKSK